MLTDYHLHLRPDSADTEAEQYFTPSNAERYRAAAEERGIAELGCAEHVYRFAQALDVWRHPLWRESAVDDLDDYVGFVREQTDLKLGIEADFVAGREDRLATLLDSYDWDYHPDLVKMWGARRPVPEGDLRRFYELAMDGIAESGIAVEVSTAGLRKPVGELYPAPAFLEMCVDAGCAVALSSDAHVPEDVGRDYERALELLESVGVKELAVFERRDRRMEAIG
jgi:histidinol-phosphatase (PHP family)